jgi:hypothetical protein
MYGKADPKGSSEQTVEGVEASWEDLRASPLMARPRGRRAVTRKMSRNVR